MMKITNKQIIIGILVSVVVFGFGFLYGQSYETQQHSKEHAAEHGEGDKHMGEHGSHEGGDMKMQGAHGGHAHADPKEAELIEKLQKGGYVMFARHERTQLDKTLDDRPLDFANCASQRQLSEAGRLNAIETGQVIKNFGIKIDAAYASPYCRTKETSERMFGETQTVQVLSGVAMPSDEFEFEKAGMLLTEFLNTLRVPVDKNIALTAHWGNFKTAFGTHLGEGDVAVLQKNSEGKFEVLGVIHPATWNDVTHDKVRAQKEE